jgi:putative transcriptional regulator
MDLEVIHVMGKNLRLKAARAAKDMSQKELAEAASVTRQTVNAIEMGDYNPSVRLCAALCKALGKTLNDLFWEDDDETQRV